MYWPKCRLSRMGQSGAIKHAIADSCCIVQRHLQFDCPKLNGSSVLLLRRSPRVCICCVKKNSISAGHCRDCCPGVSWHAIESNYPAKEELCYANFSEESISDGAVCAHFAE